MAELARKVSVFCQQDGLVLQPWIKGAVPPAKPIKIKYEDYSISTSTAGGSIDQGSPHEVTLECFGVAGLVNAFSRAYLALIMQRKQVALLQGHSIYVVKSVVLLPLASAAEASSAIKQATQISTLDHANLDGADSHESSDEEQPKQRGTAQDSHDLDSDPEHTSHAEKRIDANDQPNVMKDVISTRGFFGKYTRDWISGRTFAVQNQGSPHARRLSSASNESFISSAKTLKAEVPPAGSNEPALLAKFLRTMQILLSTGGFYFSYDYDITRRLLEQSEVGKELPLFKRMDPLYFWNYHLVQPFIDAGHGSIVLPLMQGFVGQAQFPGAPSALPGFREEDALEQEKMPIPKASESSGTGLDQKVSETFFLTIISRRSVKRPGLRYLRRGIDDEGSVANFVESEQILHRAPWIAENAVHSYVQIRGSIPLYFFQSPYNFKPIPTIHHSFDVNKKALLVHFNDLRHRYGSVQVASLLDKTRTEAALGKEYEDHIQKLNEVQKSRDDKVRFEWFDFHAMCKGMKFENVSILVNALEEFLASIGYTTVETGESTRRQSGVVRTNCMDCLDRTGVVQSALAREALLATLQHDSLSADEAHRIADSQLFNNLWADNGDAISQQYASTAALKADFTRTGKRNYRGVFQDLRLTMTRYYNNIVNDYFIQTTIDFLLGIADADVFEEFETNLMTADPAISLNRIRQTAIDVSAKIAITDTSEDLLGAWTLLTPKDENVIRSATFSEIVFLLTQTHIYICHYDWDLGKVSSFARIDLAHITTLRYGTYITSTLTAAQTSSSRNVGFTLSYQPRPTDLVRVNTRSLDGRILPFPGLSHPASSTTSGDGGAAKQSTSVMAFKALSTTANAGATTLGATTGKVSRVSELDIVKSISDEIDRAAAGRRRAGDDEGEDGNGQKSKETEQSSLVEQKDVVSLEDAKRGTGLLEVLGFELKKMVWA